MDNQIDNKAFGATLTNFVRSSESIIINRNNDVHNN